MSNLFAKVISRLQKLALAKKRLMRKFLFKYEHPRGRSACEYEQSNQSCICLAHDILNVDCLYEKNQKLLLVSVVERLV